MNSSRSQISNWRSLMPIRKQKARRLTSVTRRLEREVRAGEVRRAIVVSLSQHLVARVGNRTSLAMIGKLLHQVALLSGEVGRSEHFEFIHEIARGGFATSRNATTLETHHAAGLAA